MDLSREIRVELLKQGASKVGYACLSDIGSLRRRGFPSAVVIGMALSPAALQGLEDGPTQAYSDEFRRVNGRLDEMAHSVEALLRNSGFHAFARTRDTLREDARTLRTAVPHKLLATRAGFGWIGNCNRLITTDFGAALRLTSVLTDAPLTYDTPVTASHCGHCRECQRACPARAISGRNWNSESDRDEFFNAFGCRHMERERSDTVGISENLCGICRAVCPYTQQYVQAALAAPTHPASVQAVHT